MRASWKLCLGAGLLILLSGCGGSQDTHRVDLLIRMTPTHPAGKPAPPDHVFTLTCNPNGGSLPFADRVCRDIARHPRAMLNPPPATSSCTSTLLAPNISVTATIAGKATGFGGVPKCASPGSIGLAVYYDAIRASRPALAADEPLLRCDEDPALLVQPTPAASAYACAHGGWTAQNSRLIRIAAQAGALGAIKPSRLFPAQIGARSCTIRQGGPGGAALRGQCGVYVDASADPASVTFVEYWGKGELAPVLIARGAKGASVLGGFEVSSPNLRHDWRVVVKDGRVIAASQNGAPAPQLHK